MTYKTLAEVNTTEGLHTLFTYSSEVTGGLFGNLLLFSLFLVVFLGNFFSQQRTRGRGDLPASFAVAGFITAGAAILMSLIPNFINGFSVVVSIVISILGILWVVLDKSSN